MEHTISLKLDVNPSSIPPAVRVKQGDGFARFLQISILKDGQPYNPGSNINFVFRCQKPDGKAVVTDSATTDQELHRKLVVYNSSTGIVTVELVSQVCAVAGACRCDLCMMQGEKVLSTLPFALEVIAAPNVANRMLSTDDFRTVMAAIAEIGDDIARINAAVSNANAAVTAANTAVSNANAAVSNAASAASSAATAAGNADSAATAANTAAGNATSAASAATSAASAANTAASSASTAADSAGSAATAANTAAGRAESAVSAANSAVSDANAAVGNANTAVSNANTAVSNANAAKTSADKAAAKVTGITASASKLAPGATPTATVSGGTESGGTVTPYSIAFGIPTFPGITASVSGVAHGQAPTATVSGGTSATTKYNIDFGIPAGAAPTPSSSYSYQNSTSGTTVPTGTWGSTPSPEKGKYLWTKIDTIWSADGTQVGTTTDYIVSYIGADGSGAVVSVNGKIGTIVLSASDINTSGGDSIETALGNKVDAAQGKGLSTNDYTTTEKNKLAGIAAGAEVNVQPDWNQSNTGADDYIKNKPTIPAAQVSSDWNATSGVAQILNKPTLGTAAAKNVPSSGNAATGEVVLGNDTRLTDARNAADVSAWAKAASKPTYNAGEIGYSSSASYGDDTVGKKLNTLQDEIDIMPTYQWREAVSGGTDLSLVTTGEKALWNSGVTSIIDLTLTANDWSNNTPATQTLTATGVTANNNILLVIGSSATSAQYDAACEAKLLCTAQAANSITVTAYGDKPDVAIPISVMIFG